MKLQPHEEVLIIASLLGELSKQAHDVSAKWRDRLSVGGSDDLLEVVERVEELVAEIREAYF